MLKVGNKIGRNDPCSCGSGKKYKNCCLKHGEKKTQANRMADKYRKRHGITLKTQEQIGGMRAAGQLVLKLLEGVRPLIKPGVTTNQINKWVDQFTRDHDAIPAPLNYRGFPKSVCTSINEVICHGIPSDRPLCDGDIINVDVTPILNGYYADANYTYFVGTPSADAIKIVNVSRECLRRALLAVKPGNHIGDLGAAIQAHAEGMGCSVVREYVGHGVGMDFHERPDIPHYGRPGKGIELIPGMTFTIEPGIYLPKRGGVRIEDDIVVTEDGGLSLTSAPRDLIQLLIEG